MLVNTLGLHAGVAMHPALSPRLQKAVRLLQMSSLDFSQALRDALDSNPFLELDEAAEPEPAPEAEDTEWPGEAGAWAMEGGGRMRQDADDGVFDTLVAHVTLAEHLLGQLRLLPLPTRDLALAAAVAGSLDDDGYLRTPLEEVASALLIDPLPEPEELTIALRRVQALEPAGVGARDVAECLMLQLPKVQPEALRTLVGRVLREHLQALAGRDLAMLARRAGISREEAEAVCAAIRRLDPRPGWRHLHAPAQYLTPDVIVRHQRGQWVSALNPAVVPRLRLNQRYAELFQRHRQAQHGELSAHLQEAKWTLRNVEQRFATILSVARAILKRQHRFLVYGPMAMRPLALREIAEEVGVHESTVSRVTNNKYMATPCGVFELKYFFSRALATASGGECSPTAIRGLIRELIAAEPAARPLSDVDLARQLAQQGLPVARRTVTKYRQQMKIDPAPRRGAEAR